MEGPYIKFETNHEYSETPKDSGFSELMERIQESNPPLGSLLEQINKSSGKKEIITHAIIASGHTWLDLQTMNKEAALAFGRLLAFWDSPAEGKPKSLEMHAEEASEFARKL